MKQIGGINVCGEQSSALTWSYFIKASLQEVKKPKIVHMELHNNTTSCWGHSVHLIISRRTVGFINFCRGKFISCPSKIFICNFASKFIMAYKLLNAAPCT